MNHPHGRVVECYVPSKKHLSVLQYVHAAMFFSLWLTTVYMLQKDKHIYMTMYYGMYRTMYYGMYRTMYYGM